MKRIFALTLLVLLMAVGSARAGVDISFGANVPVGDDANLFFSISSRYFDRDQRAIEDWGRRCYPDPDDLAVALFLSLHCDKDPEFFFSLRQQGLGWFEISNRCRVPVDVYFVPVERDPGPPYGNAYGHWKKHRHDRKHVMVLDDRDIRNLVAVRMVHEYYGVPVDVAMQWRSSGSDVRKVMNGEYRKRHAEKGDRGAGDNDQGKGHKNREDSKGHEDHKDHKDQQNKGKDKGKQG
jgi:hypothetical protein